MRFSAAAVAFFAGLAIAAPGGDIETIYSTDEVTITSCAPTVTDCPGNTASATTEPTGVEPTTDVPTTSVPAATSSVPVVPEQPETPSSSSAVPPVVPSEEPTVPSVPEVPTGSVSVFPVTTCIPTVTYSTITVTPTAGATTSKPVIPGAPSVVPSSAGATGTASATPSPSAPAFTGAANAVTNSFGFAGAAAVAAIFLA
ncbi:hypothetical protein BJX99DRAFT_263142 [Aspergillus californicus]